MILSKIAASISNLTGNSPRLLSRLETLEYIVENDLSIARYGDGECNLMIDEVGIHFQEYSPELRDRLIQVLRNNNEKLLVTFNNEFTRDDEYKVVMKYSRGNKSYDRYISTHSENDVGVLERSRERKEYQEKFKNFKKIYAGNILGDATLFFLGFYFNEYKSKRIDRVLSLYTKLFEGRNILFVCPADPMLKPSFKELVETKVIDSPKSTRFIEIPKENAFSDYDNILKNILEQRDSIDTVILQAGPTATILADELSSKYNLRAYDVGSLNESLYKAWLETNVHF
jgi:hypothetical protein